MKILFTRFPLESAYGGAEIQTISLMEGLIARGHAVAFAGSCPVLRKQCAERGIPQAEWHIGPPPVTKVAVVSFLWRKRAMRRKLLQMLDQFHGIDAICMLSLSEKLLLTRTASSKGIRVFWIEHDRIGPWLTRNPWLPMLLATHQSAVTVPVSDLSAKLYTALGWNPLHVHSIANGIDVQRIGPPLHRRRLDASDPLRLGCITRLSPEKGVDVLLAAFANVRQPQAANHSLHLTIVGTGPQERHLRRLAHSLGIADRVTFAPPMNDVRTVYDRLDALVLPSRDHDPFGLVAAEAMAKGLPVIVTDACGITSSLTQEEALIVNSNSVSALEEAISQLIHPETYNLLTQKGPTTARKKFSLSTMVETYEEVLTLPPPPPST